MEVRHTEMSMSVRCDGCGLEYAGGRGLRGLFAQRRRLLDRDFLRLLVEVRRFHRRASAFLRVTDDEDGTTYGDFLRREGFSDHFIAHYAVPVVSCVWSTGRATAAEYPARYLFRFLEHHGMLRITGSPQWSTVVGGSRTYVDRLRALLPDVRAGRAVVDVTRHGSGVQVRDVTGQVSRFDRVVVATHADQALSLLVDPSDEEVTTLKQFAYSSNATVLHTDDGVLPEAPGARASWNYRMASCDRPDQPTVVTYWMNRLQGLRSTQQFLVTLNDRERIAPGSVHAVVDYEHPVYTVESVRAQAQLPRPGHRPDRLRRRLPRLGLPRGRVPFRRRSRPALRGAVVTAAAGGALPRVPALVVGHVSHNRPGPLRHSFRHSAYQWLVDLDAIPEQPAYLRPFARFSSADHLGDRTLSIKQNVERFLALRGVELGAGARILMLANARILGHVFDPLSVFWCYAGDGRLACVVAEVHNTYGERHAYLLRPDADGKAGHAKELYVSPFFDASGGYQLRFAIGPDLVSTSVVLRRAGSVAFSATFRGRPQPATRTAVLRQLVRRPLMTQRVSALIRIHGIWLWLRGLPVRPRPTHVPQEGV